MEQNTTHTADGSATPAVAQNNAAPVTSSRAEANAAIRSIAELSGLPREWADAAIDAERNVDDIRTAAFDAMRARAAAAGNGPVDIGAGHRRPWRPGRAHP